LFSAPFTGVRCLSHDDAEPALAVLDYPEHLLVMGAGEVGLVDDDGQVHSLCFGANPVDPAGSLFERARVPVEVVVDHVTTLLVQVDALGHDRACNEDLWEERGIEGQHQAASGVRPNSAVSESDVWEKDLAVVRAFRGVKVIGGARDPTGLDACKCCEQYLAFDVDHLPKGADEGRNALGERASGAVSMLEPGEEILHGNVA
jgi:hypothetical protein